MSSCSADLPTELTGYQFLNITLTWCVFPNVMTVLLQRLDDLHKCRLYMRTVICRVDVEFCQHLACSGNLKENTLWHVAAVMQIQPRCAARTNTITVKLLYVTTSLKLSPSKITKTFSTQVITVVTFHKRLPPI